MFVRNFHLSWIYLTTDLVTILTYGKNIKDLSRTWTCTYEQNIEPVFVKIVPKPLFRYMKSNTVSIFFLKETLSSVRRDSSNHGKRIQG